MHLEDNIKRHFGNSTKVEDTLARHSIDKNGNIGVEFVSPKHELVVVTAAAALALTVSLVSGALLEYQDEKKQNTSSNLEQSALQKNRD